MRRVKIRLEGKKNWDERNKNTDQANGAEEKKPIKRRDNKQTEELKDRSLIKLKHRYTQDKI